MSLKMAARLHDGCGLPRDEILADIPHYADPQSIARISAVIES